MGQAASSFPDDPILARAGHGADPHRAPDEGEAEPKPPLTLVPPPKPAAAAPAPGAPAAQSPPEPVAGERAAKERTPDAPFPPKSRTPEPPVPVQPPTSVPDDRHLIQDLAETPQGMMEREPSSAFSRPFELHSRAGQPQPTPRRPIPDQIVGKEAPLELPRRETPKSVPAEKPALERAQADEPPHLDEPAPAPPVTGPVPDPSILDDGVPWATPKPLTIHSRSGTPAAPRPARQAQIIPHPASVRPAEPEAAAAEDDDDPLAGWKPQYVDLEEEGLPAKSAEPLLQVIVRALRENRTAQLAAAGVVLIILALIVFQPWAGAPGVSLRDIKRDPSRFSGREIRVRGRIGEVFPMGNGFTFWLIQGRDTMAVFTRSRTPLEGERVEVTGTVQPGVLDGVTRLALFEQVR